MDIRDPEDPCVLDIVSCTYGGTDFTTYTRAQYNKFIVQNPGSTSWTFTASNDFFGQDPNVTIVKVCVCTWRNTFSNADGSISWSDFHSQAMIEHSSATISIDFSGVNDTAWVAPNVPKTGQFVVAAYWYNTDVTSSVANQLNSLFLDPFQGTSINVSVGSLGPDPAVSNPSKQLTLVYGTWGYPKRWTFHTKVQMGSSDDWTLLLPVLFPPVQLPNMNDVNTYVTFKNVNAATSIWPQIYGEDMDLFWDGKGLGLAIAPGVRSTTTLFPLLSSLH